MFLRTPIYEDIVHEFVLLWRPFFFFILTLCNFPFCSKEDVERCKQKDLIAELLAQLTGDFPKLSEIIVKERDAYLARSIRLAAIPREVTDPDGGICSFIFSTHVIPVWGRELLQVQFCRLRGGYT